MRGLQKSPSPWRTDRALNECFGTLDAEVLGPWTRTESMDKNRKLGWNGFVDTTEGIRATIEQLAELRMVSALSVLANANSLFLSIQITSI